MNVKKIYISPFSYKNYVEFPFKRTINNNSVLLYCAHFYYRHFILVNSDKTPSIKVCTVQQNTTIIK